MVQIEDPAHLPPIYADAFAKLRLRHAVLAHLREYRELERDTRRNHHHRLPTPRLCGQGKGAAVEMQQDGQAEKPARSRACLRISMPKL